MPADGRKLTPRGRERRQQLLDFATKRFAEHGYHPTSVADIVGRHAGKVDLAIVGGGDGTLNAAADALVEARLPLAILPLGTANDLARTLGVPTDLAAACSVIERVSRRRRGLSVGFIP